MSNKIAILGSINVDTTYHVERFPQPGETISAISKSSAPGGKGANQAVAAARSGAQTYFIGKVGDDNEGKFMLEALKEEHVDTNCVVVDKVHGTGTALVTLDVNGQNHIMVYGGANQALLKEDLQSTSDVLDSADFLISQFETPQEVTAAAFQEAKKHGVITFLNPAPAHKINPEVLKHTDIIAPNETESAILTGIKLSGEDSMLKTAEYFADKGVDNLLITLGSRGVFYSTPTGHGLVPAFKVKAVDTTAAGDTFVGAMASQLHTSLDNIEEALVYGQRASSLTVQKMGAMPSIPFGDQVEEALNEN